MPSLNPIRLIRHFRSLLRDAGYRAGFSGLSELRRERDGYRAALEATQLRQGYDGYRAAFESLQVEATEWHQGRDGYRAAFEALSAEAAQLRDDRERVLKTLRKVSREARSLPPGLAGRQLCFLHIGKTAGTSIQYALFEVLRHAAIFHDSLPGFDNVAGEELILNDLVIGHFTYQHVRKMRPAKLLMTFLRDPIDRVVSNYHFLRTDSPLSGYSRVALQAAQCLSFKEFLLCDDPNVRMVTENFQTKALAYDFRPDHLDSTMTSALLESAERNLRTFDFVGISEYFDESTDVLSGMLGVELPAKKLNVNPDRPVAAPPAEELEIARSLNRLDTQLYDDARSRFERLYLGRSGTRLVRAIQSA
jgi:Galactose-3-O-sulfotransferase